MGIMNMEMRPAMTSLKNYGYRVVLVPGFHYISII